MTPMTAALCARFVMLAFAGAVLPINGCSWYGAVSDPGAEVVTRSPAGQGWKVIQYQGVLVDIPAAWERTDMDGCGFRVEHWAPPNSPACRLDEGVAFYGSATFDPTHRPGVMRTAGSGTEATAWGGYVYAGNFAVYAADADRAVVEHVLGSTRATRK